jgi:hypothetical protein
VVASLLALGSILFGRFEEHKPRWRRLLKATLGATLVVGVAATAGRAWAMTLVLFIVGAVAVIHAWWLPRHGVNGWTGEPRERYYELLGLDETGRQGKRMD